MNTVSKTKEYAIRYLASQNKENAEIAKELKISLDTVNSVLAKESNKISPAKTDKTKNLMIRQTSAKKNNSVSIMTEAAAQLGDEFLKNMNNTVRDTSKHIFRPRD